MYRQNPTVGCFIVLNTNVDIKLILTNSSILPIRKRSYPLNLSFEIKAQDKEAFVAHWAAKYNYPAGEKYTENIGKPLTERSRQALFEWKNGSVLSNAKMAGVVENYPLDFNGDKRARYLNHRELGGAIWNIFYLHCLDPATWPIFDQHTYRAMRYIQTGQITEIGYTSKQKYSVYVDEYIPFLRNFDGHELRQLDKALFAFGQFLKLASKYA